MKCTVTTSFHQPNNTDIPDDDADNDNANNNPGHQRAAPTMYVPNAAPHPMGPARQPQATALRSLGSTSQPLLVSREQSSVTQQAPGSTQEKSMSGTDVPSASEGGNTQWMLAAQGGDLPIAPTLLSHSATTNPTHSNGLTPLMFAVGQGDLMTVQALPSAPQIDMHVKQTNAITALICAVGNGKHDVVKALIDHGANVNGTDNMGWTPLMYAAKKGYLTIVQALLSAPKIDIDAKKANGSTALIVAAAFGKYDVVKALIDHGANVNATDNTGWTPLMNAAKKGYLTIVQALLSAPKIDMNARTPSAGTALMIAIGYGKDDVVKALIDRDADVNIPDDEGWTPLMLAAQEGYLTIVQALLSAPKINMNAKKTNGSTALMIAVDNSKDDVVKVLVDHGADVNITDDEGWTPLIWAAKKGYLTIVKTLLSAPQIDMNASKPDVGTALMAATDKGQVGVVKVLVDHGADVNITELDGRTPLIWAAEQGYLPIVETLLSAPQIDINAKRSTEKTALYMAVTSRDDDVVEALIDHGADLNQVYEKLKALLTDPDDDSDDEVEAMCVSSLDFLRKHLSQREASVGNLSKEAAWASAFSTSAVPPGPSQAAIPSPEALALDTLIQQAQVQGASLAQISFQSMRDPLLQKKLSAKEAVKLIHTSSSTPFETAVVQTLAIATQLGAYRTKLEQDLIHQALLTSRLMDEYEKSKSCLRPENINRWQVSGQTLLTRAAQAGDQRLVSALVECGAAFHLPDQHGNNALHAAVKAGAWSVCSYLLARGANPNTSDRSNASTLTYLEEALANGDQETATQVGQLITELLAKGYRLNLA